MTHPRLGEILKAQGTTSEEKLDEALALQKMQGARLGGILLGQGSINPLALAHALAVHHGLPFADLETSPPDSALLDEAQLPHYIALGTVPWKREGGHVTLAVTDAGPPLHGWAEEIYGKHYRLAVASSRDILHAIGEHFGLALDEASRESLFHAAPERSAKFLLPKAQRYSLLALLALLAVLTAIFTHAAIIALVAVMNIFYCLTITLKALLLYAGFFRKPASVPAVSDAELPLYTILVPLYREAASLPRLIASLRGLDYPRAKLDIKLIVEADDAQTIQAIKQVRPEGIFEMIPVPFSLPRTKPKACNYALKFARGEFVTIYDAEDAPEPNQLRLAVARFRASPVPLTCLQARLNYYNAPRNLLTRLFAIEYSTWFDFMLPGLEMLQIPIPLGGTSNHLRLDALRELGEWDPYNVTEDADLGVRLSVSRRETAMLDSITMEEAPACLWPWIKQRSRWIKGYMQTWIVHMRNPKSLFDTVGGRGFWGFQFFIGGPCLVFLTAPLLWAIWIAWEMDWLGLPDSAFPGWLGPVTVFNLLLGFGVHAAMAILAIRRWRWQGMTLALLCYPFYWLLHSVAAYRALWQLITRPHYWDKTSHGQENAAFPPFPPVPAAKAVDSGGRDG